MNLVIQSFPCSFVIHRMPNGLEPRASLLLPPVRLSKKSAFSPRPIPFKLQTHTHSFLQSRYALDIISARFHNVEAQSAPLALHDALEKVCTHRSITPVPPQASYASLGSFLAGVEVFASGFAVARCRLASNADARPTVGALKLGWSVPFELALGLLVPRVLRVVSRRCHRRSWSADPSPLGSAVTRKTR